MRSRSAVFAAGVLAALAGWSGCRSSPPPEELFAEAEGLRLRYEKEASQQAIAKYQLALAAWKRAGDTRGAARAGRQLGTTLRPARLVARSPYAPTWSALSLAQESADRLLESEILSDAGIAQSWWPRARRRSKRPAGHCQAALDLAGSSGAGREEAKALSCLGEVAYDRQRRSRRSRSTARPSGCGSALGDRGAAPRRCSTRATSTPTSASSTRRGLLRARVCRCGRLLATGGNRRSPWSLDARLQGRRGEYQKAVNEFAAALAPPGAHGRRASGRGAA